MNWLGIHLGTHAQVHRSIPVELRSAALEAQTLRAVWTPELRSIVSLASVPDIPLAAAFPWS